MPKRKRKRALAAPLLSSLLTFRSPEPAGFPAIPKENIVHKAVQPAMPAVSSEQHSEVQGEKDSAFPNELPLMDNL